MIWMLIDFHDKKISMIESIIAPETHSNWNQYFVLKTKINLIVLLVSKDWTKVGISFNF